MLDQHDADDWTCPVRMSCQLADLREAAHELATEARSGDR